LAHGLLGRFESLPTVFFFAPPTCIAMRTCVYKEAPLDSLHNLSRASRITGLVFAGCWPLLGVLGEFTGYFYVCAGQRCDDANHWEEVFAATGLLMWLLACVTYCTHLSQSKFEQLFCSLHVLCAVARLCVSPTLQQERGQFVDIILDRLLFVAVSGVRLGPFFATCLCELVIDIGACLWYGWPLIFKPDAFVWFSFMIAMLVGQQRSWAKLHDYQQALQAEQEASEALFTIFCDAKFWVAGDASTVVTKDLRFDSIVGAATLGGQLQQYLSAEDTRRLRATVEQMVVPSEASAHAVLLPVTLQRQVGDPIDVDLFIVDRRSQGGGGHRGSEPCSLGCGEHGSAFLIGLRLARSVEPYAPLGSADALEEAADVPASPCAVAVGEFQASSWEVRPDVVHCERLETRSLVTEVSVPRTLKSSEHSSAEISTCSRQELEGAILAGKWAGFPLPLSSAQEKATLLAAIHLVCDRAQGGALLCVGQKHNFDKVFGAAAPGLHGAMACLTTSDGGYMTKLLKHVHIGDERFAAAFAAFTEPSEDDRWPANHPDPQARGKPKNGAFLMSPSGYRLKCAVKILGITPPRSWTGGGTRHEAALACASAVQDCYVLVRSGGGAVHVVFCYKDALQVIQLDPGV